MLRPIRQTRAHRGQRREPGTRPDATAPAHHHIVASILNTFRSGRVVGAARWGLENASQVEPKPSGGTGEEGGCTQYSWPAVYVLSAGLPVSTPSIVLVEQVR